MIYDKIENASRYQFASKSLMMALEDVIKHQLFLEESEFYNKSIIEFHTSPLIEKQAEFHKRFIDIHVVLEGKEYVEVGHIDNLNITENYNQNKDIGFGLLQTDNKFAGYLTPGYFLVCFPEDAHLVGAHLKEKNHTTKIVYKVPVEENLNTVRGNI